MKSKIISILLGLIKFVLTFLLVWVFLASVFILFWRFGYISDKICFYIPLTASLLITIGYLIAENRISKSEKNSALYCRIINNRARFVLMYIVVVLFLVSFKTELIWDFDTMTKALSLEWTILAISIAILLVWNGFVINYLNERKPQKPISNMPVELWLFIEKKSNFYSDVCRFFSTLILLSLNVMVLALSTAFVYLIFNRINLLCQNAVILSLFLCLNTMIQLFIDILTTLYKKKHKLLDGNKVTEADVELQNKISRLSTEVSAQIKVVKSIDNLEEDERKQLINKIVGGYINKFDLASDKNVTNP